MSIKEMNDQIQALSLFVDLDSECPLWSAARGASRSANNAQREAKNLMRKCLLEGLDAPGIERVVYEAHCLEGASVRLIQAISDSQSKASLKQGDLIQKRNDLLFSAIQAASKGEALP